MLLLAAGQASAEGIFWERGVCVKSREAGARNRLLTPPGGPSPAFRQETMQGEYFA